VRGLAGAERLHIRPRDQFDLHLRYLAEAKDRIVGPCVAGDALAVKADALLQYPAGGLDRATFDLIDHAVRIDGFADIDSEGQPFDANVLLALDFSNDSTIGSGVLVAREAKTVAGAGFFVRFPVRASGGGADDILCPLIG